MRKIIISIFLVLTFLCSSVMSETAADWYKKADALRDGNRYADPEKAIKYFSNAIKLKPDWADAYYSRGIVYASLGQYQRAIENYNVAIRLNPNDAIAYTNRGFAYDNLRQEPLAIKDYSQAICLKSDYLEAYKNRAIDYLNQGNNKLGCSDAQKACALGNCNLFEMAKRKGNCR